jgi:fluoroquinolone resistance protein
MELIINEDKVFEGLDRVEKTTTGREFQSCTFRKCDFSNSNFPGNKFVDCVFDGCNLSMMHLQNSFLNNVEFYNCKILGVNFSECQNLLFSVKFENCILDYASFMGKKMLNTRFIKTSLKETTFSQANLAGSLFEQSDLSGTVFNRTDLGGANFATSYNYTIDPELNNIKKAVFSSDGIPGLLTKHQIRIV